MKPIIIFALSALVYFDSAAQAVKPHSQASKSEVSHTASKQVSKLLLKCNEQANILVNDTALGMIEANQIKAFAIPSGKSFLSIVPVDGKNFTKFDTIISVNPNDQEVLMVRLNQKAISTAMLLKNIFNALGIDQFGKKISAISYSVQMPGKNVAALYQYPDKGFIHEVYKGNNGVINEIYNEQIIYNNTAYSRNFFMLFTDGTTNQPKELINNREMGVSDNDRKWETFNQLAGQMTPFKNILQDLFFDNRLFDITNQEYVFLNPVTEEIDGKLVYKLQMNKVQSNDPNAISFAFGSVMYVDKSTYLPIRIIVDTQVPNVSSEHREFSYSNYKYVAPVMLPTKIESIIVVKGTNYYGPGAGISTVENIIINPVIPNPETKFFKPDKVSAN